LSEVGCILLLLLLRSPVYKKTTTTTTNGGKNGGESTRRSTICYFSREFFIFFLSRRRRRNATLLSNVAGRFDVSVTALFAYIFDESWMMMAVVVERIRKTFSTLKTERPPSVKRPKDTQRPSSPSSSSPSSSCFCFYESMGAPCKIYFQFSTEF
jgi:hypothetical protein